MNCFDVFFLALLYVSNFEDGALDFVRSKIMTSPAPPPPLERIYDDFFFFFEGSGSWGNESSEV